MRAAPPRRAAWLVVVALCLVSSLTFVAFALLATEALARVAVEETVVRAIVWEEPNGKCVENRTGLSEVVIDVRVFPLTFLGPPFHNPTPCGDHVEVPSGYLKVTAVLQRRIDKSSNNGPVRRWWGCARWQVKNPSDGVEGLIFRHRLNGKPDKHHGIPVSCHHNKIPKGWRSSHAYTDEYRVIGGSWWKINNAWAGGRLKTKGYVCETRRCINGSVVGN